MTTFTTEELEWVRMNAKGRQVKSKARLARYEEMASEAANTKRVPKTFCAASRLKNGRVFILEPRFCKRVYCLVLFDHKLRS